VAEVLFDCRQLVLQMHPEPFEEDVGMQICQGALDEIPAKLFRQA
jgi:hypothetical protein